MRPWLPLVLAGVIAVPCTPVLSQGLLTLPAAEARGDLGVIPTITVALDQGIHLKFPGQRVYKGWLDNDIGEVDSDRPFEQGGIRDHVGAAPCGDGQTLGDCP